jgi:hypothetical protein
MKRSRYQNGQVYLDRRINTWYFRWRDESKARRAERLGTLTDLPTKAKAIRAAEGYRLTINAETRTSHRWHLRLSPGST